MCFIKRTKFILACLKTRKAIISDKSLVWILSAAIQRSIFWKLRKELEEKSKSRKKPYVYLSVSHRIFSKKKKVGWSNLLFTYNCKILLRLTLPKCCHPLSTHWQNYCCCFSCYDTEVSVMTVSKICLKKFFLFYC